MNLAPNIAASRPALYHLDMEGGLSNSMSQNFSGGSRPRLSRQGARRESSIRVSLSSVSVRFDSAPGHYRARFSNPQLSYPDSLVSTYAKRSTSHPYAGRGNFENKKARAGTRAGARRAHESYTPNLRLEFGKSK